MIAPERVTELGVDVEHSVMLNPVYAAFIAGLNRRGCFPSPASVVRAFDEARDADRARRFTTGAGDVQFIEKEEAK